MVLDNFITEMKIKNGFKQNSLQNFYFIDRCRKLFLPHRKILRLEKAIYGKQKWGRGSEM